MSATAPGQDITIHGLTWPKLLAIIGAILVGAGAVIEVLVSLVYGGIQEKIDTRWEDAGKRIDALTARMQEIDTEFKTAIVAGLQVQNLLTTAPTLQADINTTRTDVATLTVQMKALQQSERDDTASIRQQLQQLQQSVDHIQTQTSYMIERLPKR